MSEEFTVEEKTISGIRSKKAELKKPIQIIIETHSDDDFVSKYKDIISGWGVTKSEAINHIKSEIVELYFELKEDKGLEPYEKDWLKDLKRILKEK